MCMRLCATSHSGLSHRRCVRAAASAPTSKGRSSTHSLHKCIKETEAERLPTARTPDLRGHRRGQVLDEVVSDCELEEVCGVVDRPLLGLEFRLEGLSC